MHKPRHKLMMKQSNPYVFGLYIVLTSLSLDLMQSGHLFKSVYAISALFDGEVVQERLEEERKDVAQARFENSMPQMLAFGSIFYITAFCGQWLEK